MIDVVVVGGGPGGSVAAKKCAEYGLRTLLVEKRTLPREKVCSGAVMSRLAKNIIDREFGTIPREVLTTPPYLSGVALHVPGVGSHRVGEKMPYAWRKDLDYWLNQKVIEAGGELWESARVTDVAEEKEGYTVRLEREGQRQEVRARFVLGADGAGSAVRKALFPELKPVYLQAYQECYHGALDIDKDRLNFIFPPELFPQYLCVEHKGDVFLISTGVRIGQVKVVMHNAKEMLARRYGFAPEQQPLWKKGCLEPLLYRDLLSGSFSAARGNVLLIGDAAGLPMPLTGEGIGTALKSGLLAAHSVIEAKKAEERAEGFYLRELAPIVTMFREKYAISKDIRERASKGGQYLLEAMKQPWEQALSIE
jgi:flavin-dependent dehydrogenase